MPETNFPSFDDPGLKAAIGRAWGSETAPPQLRARLLTAASSGAARSAPVMPLIWRLRVPLYGLAAAAVVVVAVMLVFHPGSSRPSNSNPVASSLVMPASLADDLVARHDICCGENDHHGIASDDFAQIRRELREQLGFPVLSASIPGWNFHGASVCLVGKTKSGHLVFARKDGQFVSLFSLPPQLLEAQPTSADYSEMAQKHPLAGFQTPGGLYFVVGSSPDGSLTLDEVRSMRERLRLDVAEADDGPPVSLASH